MSLRPLIYMVFGEPTTLAERPTATSGRTETAKIWVAAIIITKFVAASLLAR